MYKASTYFTSLFSKLRVTDKKLRKNILGLFGGLVESVLKNVPESRRIPVLKFISVTIKDAVTYLTILQKQNKELDPQTLKVFRSLIDLNKNLIIKIGVRTTRSTVADRILNEAFLSDIACDIGECVRDFKKTTSMRARIEILQRLKVLLNDYNAVLQTELTARDVLEGKVSNKNRP